MCSQRSYKISTLNMYFVTKCIIYTFKLSPRSNKHKLKRVRKKGNIRNKEWRFATEQTLKENRSHFIITAEPYLHCLRLSTTGIKKKYIRNTMFAFNVISLFLCRSNI